MPTFRVNGMPELLAREAGQFRDVPLSRGQQNYHAMVGAALALSSVAPKHPWQDTAAERMKSLQAAISSLQQAMADLVGETLVRLAKAEGR